MCIGNNFTQIIEKDRQKIGLIYEEKTLSYEQLVQHIGSIQQYLLDTLGTQEKTRRIALKLGNEPSFIEVFFASVMLGYSCIPLDPKWTDEQLDYVLKNSKPDLIVTNDLYQEMLQVTSCSLRSFAKLGDLFYIGYTSGSTGRPKGFMRNQQSWIDSFNGSNEAFQISEHDIIAAPGPLCHSLSLFAAVYAIHIGATFILHRHFEGQGVIASLQKYNATTMFVVPTMLKAMLDQKYDEVLSIAKILSSGAKWLPTQKQEIRRLFPNSERIEFYGASETSYISYLNEEGFNRYPNSVGKVFPGVTVTIKGQNGHKLRANEIGLIFVNSTMLFSGYLEDQIDSALNELTVGDLGYISEDGYLTLVGRQKNMIISGGLNIYPEEIEAFLKKHTCVEEAAVVGVPDEYWGEKVVALIKIKSRQALSKEDIVSFCKSGLSSYKCPKVFYSVQDFPYTSSGKIARTQLDVSIGSEIL
ncbi:AMP-binding protein [Bacillus salitolerans]|uniref:AMP-binding protein n=1 Tax=Bacillus salitolerans TaxID=1437434 RepID=A0ABW4LNU0_9BACI